MAKKSLQNHDNSDRVLYYNHDTPPELVNGLLQLALENGLELKRRRPPKDEEAEEPTPDEVLAEQLAQVKGVMNDIGAEYQPATGTFLWGKQEYTPDSMAIRAYSALSVKNGLTKDAAKCAMETFIAEERQRLIEAARGAVLAHDPSVGDNEIRKFVALMRGIEPSQVNGLDVAALQSLIWQVKRKFAGHTLVEHPLMVVFSGGQGFGKSWTLARLFEPVGIWRAGGVRLNEFNNKFNMTVFNQYFVVPFEEMSPSGNYDIEMLKNTITEDYISYRVPHKQVTLKLLNNATCYGTTNHRAADCLKDPTGARRWWEIQCPARPWNDDDAAKLAQVDFKAIWLSVDGRSEANPRRPVLEEMRAVQLADLRPPSYLEQFFQEEIEVDEDAPGLSQAEVYAALAEWFRIQGLRQPTKHSVYRWVLEKGASMNIAVKNHSGYPIYQGFRLRRSPSET